MTSCSETKIEETKVKTTDINVEENKTSVNVTTKNTTNNNDNKTTVTNKVNVTQKDSSNIVTKLLETQHEFSYPNQKDIFKISLNGKSILDANVIFTINSYKGQKIYEDKFPSNFLVGYSNNVLTKQEQEKRIIKNFNDFFKLESFRKPAIKNETFDPYYIKKEVFDDIKNDKNSIGFVYTLGSENTKFIAFHKKSGTTVMYFNCC